MLNFDNSLLKDFLYELAIELYGVSGEKKRLNVISRIMARFNLEAKVSNGKTLHTKRTNYLRRITKEGICIQCFKNPVDRSRSNRMCTECLDKCKERYVKKVKK